MVIFNKEKDKQREVNTDEELDFKHGEEKIIEKLSELNFNDLKEKRYNYFCLHYKYGVSLEECLNIIKLMKKYNIYGDYADEILDLSILLNNKIKLEKLIIIMSENEGNIFDYVQYIRSSRSYYVDVEAWYARIYTVILNKQNLEQALEEDKMRVGIYPSISNCSLEEILATVQKLNQEIKEVSNEVDDNKEFLNNIKDEIKNTSDKTIEKVTSISKISLEQINSKKFDILEAIDRTININPSSKKELLKEIQNQYGVIDAFNEEKDIKERYNKLISLKDSKTIYHPKFDDVLKYILAGNTVCLEGPVKCGKTELVKSLAKLLNLSFSNLGNIHDEISQINGYYDFNTNYNKPTFQEKFENGGVVLMKNIDTAPIQAIYALNNIISNFSYNPYIFGDKKLTTPNKNFRLIMTNNNSSIDRSQIDNLVTVKMEYDTNFESSLTDDINLIEFLHELRKREVLITTSTFVDFTNHLKLRLFDEQQLIEDYIISKNSIELLKNVSENINQDNKYTKVLKRVLTK